MFRKPQDLLLSTKTNIRKKEVKEIRATIKYNVKNYTDEIDKELFGSGNDIELLKLKSGIQIIKQKDGYPLFIQTPDKRFYPTVFALWKTPSIVPIIYTNSFVSSKIMGGAGLMVPGIEVPKEGMPSLLNKTVVAVATMNNPLPFAIGYCCVGNFTEMMESGKGKVIEIVHSFGDCLFEEYCVGDYPDGFTSTGVYPLLQASVELTEEEPTESPETAEAAEAVEAVEAVDATEVIEPVKSAEGAEGGETPDTVDKVDKADTVDPVKERVVSEKEMDDQFLHLCIRCLHDVGSEELPMQTSSFNSKYLSQPEFVNKHFASEYYCGDVMDGKGLRWNQTSFKKLSKLIKYLDEKKVIVVKEVNKQPTIVTVNWTHPWLQKYDDYIEHFKNEAVKNRSGRITPPPSKEESRTSVTSVYKINKIMKYLFLEMQMDPDGLYSMADAKSVLNGYIQLHSLIHEDNPSQVILDDLLLDAFYRDKKQPIGGWPECLSRREVAQLFEEKLIPYHAVQVNTRLVVKKGSCGSIEISTIKVKGAKSLQTCVRHYEDYSIDAKELLKSLTKACASSGSIQADHEGQYLQIQGKVAPSVKDCLIKEYKIPSKFINVKK